MSKRTRESLQKDIEMAQKIAKQMNTDLSLLKVGVAGLSALCCALATEAQDELGPEPVPDTSPGIDASDGN